MEDMKEKLAEALDTDVEKITGFVVAVEHETEDGLTLSSVWSAQTPIWRLLSYSVELHTHLEQQR